MQQDSGLRHRPHDAHARSQQAGAPYAKELAWDPQLADASRSAGWGARCLDLCPRVLVSARRGMRRDARLPVVLSRRRRPMAHKRALLLSAVLLLGWLTCSVGGANRKQKVDHPRKGAAAGRRRPRADQEEEWFKAEGLGALDGHGLPAAALQCTVERVPAADMTAETFRRKFDLQRPVILSGAVDAWGVATAAFRRAALLELADRTGATVMAGVSSSIPKHHGAGHRRVKLRWLVESTMGKPQSDSRAREFPLSQSFPHTK